MGIFSYIKSFFVKELEDIIAPIDRIKSDIADFIHKQEVKIEADATRVKDLLKTNEQRVANNIKASTIVKNLEALLGG